MVKADLQAGLLFGQSHLSIHGKPLSKYLKLPPDASVDQLMGVKPGDKAKQVGRGRGCRPGGRLWVAG